MVARNIHSTVKGEVINVSNRTFLKNRYLKNNTEITIHRIVNISFAKDRKYKSQYEI
jgi:uncharacterized protein (UPF0248 family)